MRFVFCRYIGLHCKFSISLSANFKYIQIYFILNAKSVHTYTNSATKTNQWIHRWISLLLAYAGKKHHREQYRLCFKIHCQRWKYSLRDVNYRFSVLTVNFWNSDYLITVGIYARARDSSSCTIAHFMTCHGSTRDVIRVWVWLATTFRAIPRSEKDPRRRARRMMRSGVFM